MKTPKHTNKENFYMIMWDEFDKETLMQRNSCRQILADYLDDAIDWMNGYLERKHKKVYIDAIIIKIENKKEVNRIEIVGEEISWEKYNNQIIETLHEYIEKDFSEDEELQF